MGAEWSIVTASDEDPWPCTLVDSHGRSLLSVVNGTPVIRSRPLADLILATLNDEAENRRLTALVEAGLALADEWERWAAPGTVRRECVEELRAALGGTA